MKVIRAIFLVLLMSNYVEAQWQKTKFPINSSCFINKGNEIFVGTYHGFYASYDNGINWIAKNNGLNTNYIDTSIKKLVIKDSSIFAVTSSGAFLTKDNGNSWTDFKITLSNSKQQINALAIKDSLIFASSNAGLFVSSDNGISWKETDSIVNKIWIRDFVIKGDTIFLVSYFGIYLSLNNGEKWLKQELPNGTKSLAISGSNIIVGADYNNVYLSKNGGVWINAYIESMYNCYSVESLVAINNFVFAGLLRQCQAPDIPNAGVYMSSNADDNWTSINTGLIGSALNVGKLVIDGDYIYAFTGDGVWRRLLSEITGIIESKTNQNIFNVFPNPANKEINIEIQDPSIERNLILYNLNGKELIKQIVSDRLTKIDIGKLPKGIFLVKLICDNGVDVRKILIQ